LTSTAFLPLIFLPLCLRSHSNLASDQRCHADLPGCPEATQSVGRTRPGRPAAGPRTDGVGVCCRGRDRVAFATPDPDLPLLRFHFPLGNTAYAALVSMPRLAATVEIDRSACVFWVFGSSTDFERLWAGFGIGRRLSGSGPLLRAVGGPEAPHRATHLSAGPLDVWRILAVNATARVRSVRSVS
jgi:hypothetical protein